MRRRRKKVVVGREQYMLKRRTKGGGLEKVMVLAKPQPIEELYQHLVAGQYVLDKYAKGQQGFERVWGPYEVLGEEAPARAPPAMKTAKQKIEEALAPIKELEEAAGIYDQYFGLGALTKVIEKGEKTYESLSKLFSKSTTGEAKIPVSGTVPAALVYAPELGEKLLDSVEKRLDKWGVIGTEKKETILKEPLMRFPEKPVSAMGAEEIVESVKTGEVKVKEETEETEESGETGK